MLSGAWDPSRTALAVPESAEELDLLWELGHAAVSLDVDGGSVTLDDGRQLAHDGLIIATGARARTLPGVADRPGVYVLRTLEDSLAIRGAIEAGAHHVVVVGAGFIGAEVAATCRGLDLDVTLVEPLPTPLARALPPVIGEVVADLHREHGVDLRLGVGVEAVESGEGGASEVRLSDGSVLVADVVVLGLGVVPNTEWLEGSGLELDNGVVCDATCLAAPGVVAAGDVARWDSRRYGGPLRIEHWDHAADQAEHAARTLLAWGAGEQGEAYDPVPWFWSDQYDRKIQFAGRAAATDEVRLIDGSFEERRFVVLFGRDGLVSGVLGMNRPAPVIRWRNQMLAGISWADALASLES